MRIRPGHLAAALVTVLLVTGCQSGPPSSPVPSADPSGSATVSASPAPPALPPTSETMIAGALGAKKITYEQSLEYRALALFNSPELPAEYRSAIPDMEAASALLGEIDRKESTLSADLLKKLEPYRVRPSDPLSILNTATARVGGLGVAAAIMVAAGTPVAWRSQTAAGGKARVWVREGATAAEDAARHAADVSKVWAAYPGIFTYPNPDMANFPNHAANPDSAIDVYFFDAGAIDPRDEECAKKPSTPFCTLSPKYNGFAPHTPVYAGNKSSGYLVIDAALEGDKAIDTIAHELAHAAQFAYDNQESSWLMESTATWVAFKVCKKLGIRPNYQYSWLPQLYGSLDKTLTRSADDNAYASWLYFLYASMQMGDGVVTSIWQAAAADGEQSEKAVDQVLPFADNFAGYGVRDWNQDPVKPMYRSADSTFPENQPKPRNAKKSLEGGQEDKLNASLPPLSSAYYEYDFTKSARDVTFDNTIAEYTDAHVWAIKTVGGVQKPPEDWSRIDKEKFCRDAPPEDVSQLILIVSNSSMTDSLDVGEPPKVTAGLQGCSGWTGTMTGTAGWTNEGFTGTARATFTGVWTADEAGDAGCNPSEAPGCTLFRPSGTIDWTFKSDHPAKNWPCHVERSGSKQAGQETHIDQQAFYTLPIDKDHMQYWGRGYFQWPAITCTPPDPSVSTPVFFDIYQQSSSSIPPAHGNTCESTDWIVDPATDTIAGSCTWYSVPQGWYKYEWHLTRLGPKPSA